MPLSELEHALKRRKRTPIGFLESPKRDRPYLATYYMDRDCGEIGRSRRSLSALFRDAWSCARSRSRDGDWTPLIAQRSVVEEDHGTESTRDTSGLPGKRL